MEEIIPVTLLHLQQRLSKLIAVPQTQNVWITAELSDVAIRGGHCYMELLQKDPDRGTTVARARAVIWASQYARIGSQFAAATGQAFASGIKVLVRASAGYHPVYGMSLVITDVNPDYTMGDLLRRRREIIERLKREGVLDLNRQLEWAVPALRIAVVSAPGAAGYGDFMNQLYNNGQRLRFTTRLFAATMQGDRAPAAIIAALNRIGNECDNWDCVVVIRGGGATSDLEAFENYELAANIAQFPLPVIIGIGHERDITVLDFVANMRVKTPTAAAEWLIDRAMEQINRLRQLSTDLLQCATDRIAGSRMQLAYIEGQLPSAASIQSQKQNARLDRALLALSSTGSKRIAPQLARLDHLSQMLSTVAGGLLQRRQSKLDSCQSLLDALSPKATLRRGYSITRCNGKTVNSASTLLQGAVITTIFADGKVTSTVN